MTIGATLQFLEFALALLNAIPVLEKWFQELTLLYVNKQKEKNNDAYTKAMAKAATGEVEDLQAAIGSKLK